MKPVPRTRHAGLLRLLCVLAVALGSLAPATVVADEAPPLRRVILISCDTLRSASLPTYGNSGPLATVGLDSLAGAGTLFLHCTTPMGWTLPAHVAMLTGLSPGAVRAGAEQAVPASVPLLAERLADAGFRCGGFPARNTWLEERFGFARGMLQYRFQDVLAPISAWTRGWAPELGLASGPGDTPFFLFFHFMDTHTATVEFAHRLPYWAIRDIDRFYHGLTEPLPDPRVTPDGRWDLAAYDPDLLRRAYDSTIDSLDLLHLRPLLRHLREADLADQTLLIVTGDHGEEIGEHGGFLHESPHAEVRDVPLILVWPGVVPAGRVVYTPVSLLDIAPTVLDYAGVPAGDLVQGLSLRPLLQDPRGFFPDRDFLIDGHRRGLALEPSALVALEEGAWWSLVAMTDTTGCAGTYEPARTAEVLALYNLDLDPAETRDVLADHPQVAAALRLRLDAALADEARLAAALLGETAGADDRVRLSDEDRRRLRALGY
ncbi:MAG: sulfatase-like hydrolase/transferase [Candidatus Krumholzibacteriia bacterium]